VATPGRDGHDREVSRDKGALAARARATKAQAVERLDAKRRQVGALDVVFRAGERDSEVGGSIMAGAIAFRTFLWTLPAALTVVLIVGATTSASGADPENVVREAGLPGFVRTTVSQAATQDQRGRIIAAAVALVALWSATGPLVRVLREAYARTWKAGRSKPKNKIRARAAAIGIGFALFAIAPISAWFREVRPGLNVVILIVPITLIAAVWLLASMMLPHGNAPVVALVPGAVLFGVAIQAFHVATVVYLAPRLANSAETYGALGGAATLLLGLYLLARLVMASAALNAALWERYMHTRRRQQALTAAVVRRQQTGTKVNLTDLLQGLRQDGDDD
jgi:uncharacterized BrkB/YihY/UPF0761 family membrane protein